jgi:hypothetical protein
MASTWEMVAEHVLRTTGATPDHAWVAADNIMKRRGRAYRKFVEEAIRRHGEPTRYSVPSELPKEDGR